MMCYFFVYVFLFTSGLAMWASTEVIGYAQSTY